MACSASPSVAYPEQSSTETQIGRTLPRPHHVRCASSPLHARPPSVYGAVSLPPTHQEFTRTTNTNWRKLHANDLSIVRTEAWVQRVWRVWWVAWLPLATGKRRGGERDGDMCDDSGFFFFPSTFYGLILNLSVAGGGFPSPPQSLGAFRGLLWDRTQASRTSYRHCA